MSTYLVPVDFSSTSDKALEYALNLMDKEVDKMILLHVYAVPVPEAEVPVDLMSRMGESYREIAETHVNKLIEKTRGEIADDLDIIGEAIPGFPVDGILNRVEKWKADLIVMGMRGNNKFLKKLLGTTASKVIQRTEVPVVVVPESASYNKINKIAYATNLEEEDILALDKVIKLAKRLEAEVHCIHIQKEEESLDTYKKELLEEAYQHELVHGSIQIDVEANDDLIMGLNRYVELKEIDLIVMLTHHRSILKRMITASNTLDMTFQSKVPVWIFQAESELLSNKK